MSADLILDRRVAVDVGKRHLSLDLTSLYSVGNGNSKLAEGEQQQTPRLISGDSSLPEWCVADELHRLP